MHVSNTFRSVLQGGPQFHVGADVMLKGGTVLNLAEPDFLLGTFKIVDSVSEDQQLEIGSTTAQQFNVSLNNFKGKFSDSEFDGATIKPYTDLIIGSDWKTYTTERCSRGIFTVTDSKSVGNAIQLTALDGMSKFDQPYTKSTLKYPATLGQILADACTCCGVTLATTVFTNSDYSVAGRPTDGAITFRDVVSYVGQLSGNFCRCNIAGALELRWYDFTKFSLTDTDENRPWDILGIVSSDIKKADTSVTGVKITGNDDAKTIYQAGTGGFVISISNPLAQDNLQTVANALGNKLIGMAFRPFTAEADENPAVEAGDVCYIRDPDGNKYKSIISNLTYTIGQNESYSGDAESAAENSSTQYSPADKAQNTADNAQKAADEAKQEIELANVTIGNLTVRITANEQGLESKVSKDDLSSEIEQLPDAVVEAFNNKDGSTQQIKFTGNGFDFFYNGTLLGHMGVAYDAELGGYEFCIQPVNGAGTYFANKDGYSVICMGALKATSLAADGLISTSGYFQGVYKTHNGSVGKTETLPIMMADGTKQTLEFQDGLYVARN